MADPAQIANDMAALAGYWRKRNDRIARASSDAARIIRDLLAGRRVDGRTWYGLQCRLIDLEIGYNGRFPSDNLTRARLCIERLMRGDAP